VIYIKENHSFGGHETVRLKTVNGQPIWVMNYFGGVRPEFLENKEIIEKVNSILRPVLMEVEVSAPFRGQKYFTDKKGNFYSNEYHGDIKKFSGKEEIRLIRADEKDWEIKGSHFATFNLDYHGGVIVPK